MVLSLFTPASNSDINRMMLYNILIKYFLWEKGFSCIYHTNVNNRLQKLYRRVAKPIISDRRIFVAVNVLKKPAQYLFAVVANVLLLLAWSTTISNAAETSEAVRSVMV